jgi:hypothetical protein
MSMAWEVTPDDVFNVLVRMGLNPSLAEVNDILNKLDCEAIEENALHGYEMDDQTAYAYEEIQTQIEQMDIRRINEASREELPLLIGTLRTEAGQKALEQRLKGS